ELENSIEQTQRPYHIVGLSYVSLYVKDFSQALAFYGQVFGPPESVDESGKIYGWRMGSTWLTLFPSSAGTAHDSNPCNTEFAVQVASVEDVDRLYGAL